MLLLQPLIGLLLISLAHGDCPILFSPVYVVVEYGKSFSVNCSSTGETDQFGLSWEKSNETIENNEDIFISVNVTDWERTLTCYMYSNEALCSQNLPVTIYKTPDNVSISIVNHRGPMIAGQQYELQCDVHDVAPVTELAVKWYKGQTLLDQTTFTEDSKTPVNVNTTLLIRPDRDDDGAQYRCEAQLDLGEDGPQYPTKSLEALSAEVHYKPKHSSSTETIIQKDVVTLNCTVKANPAPVYIWYSDHLKEEISSSVLQSSTLSPGNYTCTATNSLGSDSKVFIIKSELHLSVENQCPVQLNPQRAVVRYNGSVAVNCSALVSHKGIGWEASEGAVPKTSNNLITWRVSHLTEWDIQPFCYINYERQCQVELPVIIYKTPDNVSISIVNHTGPMIKGLQYELQCDVHDVAPVQYLAVKWYKGQTLLNQTTFTEDSKTPVNVNPTLLIRPDRDDDEAQYRCEAELDLGAEGPQTPPKETSDSLYITVYFKPIINETKLPSTVPVFRGYSKEIVCEAEGNPKPTIIWILGTNDIVYNEVLTISESTPEYVSCVAENSVGTMTRKVKVFIQDISISTVNHTEPMIAGKQYDLQCSIKYVAPFKIVDVGWYKQIKNNIIETIKTPAKLTYTVQIRPDKADNGSHFWCEAKLEAEGTQRTSTMKSANLSITVHFKPVINETKLPSVVPVFRGYSEEIVCEAEGNPKPTISWILGTNDIVYNKALTISESTPEYVSCVAENSVGTTTRQVKVFIQENYIPRILGIIAAVVVAISVIIFIYIYLTFYKKKNRTGRYDVKEPKAHKEPLADEVPMNELC